MCRNSCSGRVSDNLFHVIGGGWRVGWASNCMKLTGREKKANRASCRGQEGESGEKDKNQ